LKKVYPKLLFGQTLLLIFISFSCGFGLFTPFDRRGFVKFLFTQVAYYAVARAFSFKTPERAFNGLVITDSYCGHAFQPSFAERS
jgi:hypothetical protein